jgi:hypothetical protein
MAIQGGGSKVFLTRNRRGANRLDDFLSRVEMFLFNTTPSPPPLPPRRLGRQKGALGASGRQSPLGSAKRVCSPRGCLAPLFDAHAHAIDKQEAAVGRRSPIANGNTPDAPDLSTSLEMDQGLAAIIAQRKRLRDNDEIVC